MTHGSPSMFPVRRHIGRIVAKSNRICHPDGLDSGEHKFIQNLIVTVEDSTNHTPVIPIGTMALIMMFVPAFLAAEFLIRPAIHDFIPAFQTAGRFFCPVSIIHLSNFMKQI